MLKPPIEPMLAKLATELPEGEGWLFEPKWDGFRAIVFRDGDEVFIQSRDLKPLDRYFPELHDAAPASLPDRCVLDGEIVIADRRGLDFDALQLRLHPAASRVAKLAEETPAVVRRLRPARGRRRRPARAAAGRAPRRAREGAGRRVRPPLHLTPVHRAIAASRRTGSQRFEGAGLDGVIAKPRRRTYEPGKRAMIKVKHARTADCVVAGFRWHKNGPDDAVGSLLLGLYDDDGRAAPRRRDVVVHDGDARRSSRRSWRRCARTRSKDHPWREWAEAEATSRRACRAARAAGAPARTCPGSRCGSSASARSSTTTCRATASGTPRTSCAGVPTSRPRTAATTSSRSRPPYELAEIFGRAGLTGGAGCAPRSLPPSFSSWALPSPGGPATR